LQHGELYQIHSNQIEAPELITDAWGTVVWRWAPKPFGDSLPDEDPDGDGQRLTLNLRFPGQYFDAETGLYYNSYLYYDPSNGRYNTSDPIGINRGMNTYAYALSNPIMYIDPLGLDVVVCFYADAAMGFGHVGFGFPGEGGTMGFYPTGNPIRSRGEVAEDTQNDAVCRTLESGEDQDTCMRNCRLRRQNSPGTYTLASRQCTNFVRDCLRECGIAAGDYNGPRPSPFFEQLVEQ
jgi:RHS repeat-associated protein